VNVEGILEDQGGPSWSSAFPRGAVFSPCRSLLPADPTGLAPVVNQIDLVSLNKVESEKTIHLLDNLSLFN
jgi:hypothetical protein